MHAGEIVAVLHQVFGPVCKAPMLVIWLRLGRLLYDKVDAVGVARDDVLWSLCDDQLDVRSLGSHI